MKFILRQFGPNLERIPFIGRNPFKIAWSSLPACFARRAAPVLLSLVLAGCANSSIEEHAHDREALFSPQPPPFLNGPMAVLLTNATGYSAQAALQTDFGANPEIISGQLLARGNYLLFEPSYQAKWQTSLRTAGLTFIWDVAENHGFVLSEALQAWAPMSSDYRATNVVLTPSRTQPEKIQGHLCRVEQATIVSSEGGAAVFDVFRPVASAGNLANPPLRVSAPPEAKPLVLNLTEVRPAAPAANLFLVPNGFVKYDSAESIMSELAVRLANYKRKEAEPIAPIQPGQAPGAHMGGGP